MRSAAKTAAFLLIFAGAAWALVVQDAQAAVAQQVQSGTLTHTVATVQAVTISGVDPTKSVLLFSTRHSGVRVVGQQLRGRIPTACANPCTTIEFERVTDSIAPEPVPINIQWYVVTFGSGVKVQRNEFTIAATTTNIGITPVAAVNQAFVLWSKTASATDGTFSSDDPVVGELTTTSNLQFRVFAAGTHTVAWQVVEFTNAADITVQKGTTSLTAGALSTTATLTPAVNVNKTFLLVGFNTNGSGLDIGARMLRAELTDSTTITFTRGSGGAIDPIGIADDMTEIHWQAVELKDASIVWRGSASFAAGVAQATATLSPSVNITRAVGFASVQSGAGQNLGSSPYTGDKVLGVGSVTASLGVDYRAAAQAGAASGVLTLTINKPTGTVQDDVMIASIGVRPNTAVITAPSGWTLVRRTDATAGLLNSLATYWKAAGASEPASYDWTFDTSTGSAGGILSFLGVDTASPIEVENGQSTPSGLLHDAPSVTTAAAKMLVTAHTFASAATWTPPTGMTEDVDVTGGGQSTEVNHVLLTAPGATGVKTATASIDPDGGAAHALALRPSSHLTLTRDSTANTADVGWFVVQFNQGAGFKVGSFTKRTSIGTQTIAHGLGEVPKAIILWTNGWGPAETWGGSYWYGFGMTDGTTSKSVSASSQDAVADANNSSRVANKALTVVQYGEVVLAEADLQSWDDTNFTLNWTTADAAGYVIHFVAVGGSDISAKVVGWTMPTATGNRSVTGVGFQPNAVIHAYGAFTLVGAPPANIARGGFGLGVMDADGDQWAVANDSLDAATSADTERGQQTDAAIFSLTNTATVMKEASFVSMDAGGFTVNFTTAEATSATQVISLALKGVNVKAGSFNKTTTSPGPVSQPITLVGFRPSAVLFASFQDVAQALPVSSLKFGIGASDGMTEGSSAFQDQNGQTTMNVDSIDKTSKVFVKYSGVSQTIQAEADFTSLDTDGFTLNWTTNDAVATQILYLALAPLDVTEVRLLSFDATRYSRGVLLQWKTGYEVDNLGFHVYREINGVRTRVNRALIAGSGLAAGQGTAVTAEQRYALWDLDPAAADGSVVYWLADLDFNGKSTWHGPVTPVAGSLMVPEVPVSTALHDLGKRGRGRKVFVTHGEAGTKRGRPAGGALPQAPIDAQAAVAGQDAVKIGIRAPGWYRVTQGELAAAGLSPQVDPRALQLFVDGVEQAIRVTGETDGRFDASDAIEFYATGVDTPYTNTRVYWLAPGTQRGQRIGVIGSAATSAPSAAQGPTSFSFTLQQKERSIYFAALRNGDAENWFGSLVWEEPTDLLVTVSHVDRAAPGPAQLEVALQGVTNIPEVNPDHRVGVLVNGTDVGELDFDGQNRGVRTFAVPQAALREGENTVTLVARGGEADYSLFDVLRLSYAHTYHADADQVRVTVETPGPTTIGGFASTAIRVVDVTDPAAAVELRGAVRAEAGGFSAMTVRVPGPGPRTLVAFTEGTIASAASVQANRPSRWRDATRAHDYVVITHRNFIDQATWLTALRAQQGYQPAVVDIEDVYDEFSFGEKTPQALRDFLRWAKASWRGPPKFVVLMGDATIDPRDYAGLGDADFVPTKQVPMARLALETASDDWFVDVDDDGLPDLAVGRLPVRTADQAETMVSKIERYEQASAQPWTKEVLLVADQNGDTANFEEYSTRLMAHLPPDYRAQTLFRGGLDADTARQLLALRVNDGQLLVNYQGHGSVHIWGRDGAFLTPDDVTTSWHNATRLPLVVTMNCLNGFFHGIWDEESLAETLLRSPGGGAVAVWASSSVTASATQALVNEELFRLIFQGAYATVGEAAAAAKRVVTNRDLRRSWIFFGDPAMRLIGVPQKTSTVTVGLVVTSTTQSGALGSSSARSSQGQDVTTPSITDSDGPTPFVRLADYNGDGRDDLFLYSTDTGRWSMGVSGADATANPSGYWPPHVQVFAATLNGDRVADMLLHNDETGEWLPALNTGDGRFQLGPSTWAPRGRARLGDFNGDGTDDVFVVDAETKVGFQCLSTAKNGLTCRVGDAVAPGTLLVSDFTSDGLADVFTYDAATGHWTLGVNKGAGTFGYVSGDWAPGWSVRAANLDGDRRRDVLLVDPASGAWIEAFSVRPGEFTYRRGQGPAGGDVRLIDVDGDGRDDLLYYNAGTGQWSIGLNVAPGEFSYSSGVWAPGLTLAWGDVNGDGRADLILHDPATGRWGSLVSRRPSGATAESGTWSVGWAMEGWRP